MSTPSASTADLAEEFMERRTPLQRVQGVLHKYPYLSPLIVLIICIVIFYALNDRFLLPQNISFITQQTVVVGTLAIAQTLVILTAGIDLSIGAATTLAFDRKGTETPVSFGTDIYVSTLQPKDQAVVENAPMVFVGYGVTAAERGWDDFKGEDLKGKVAVFLINDPDFVAAKGEDVFGKFGGRTMTYYGRWTYKFEEATRRGAIAALIVHDTDGVGYGWNVVKSGGGENYGLVVPPDKVTSLALQGWISGETATKIFANAGQNLAKLRVAARRKDFKPVDLGTSFNASIPVTQAVVQSQNVLAKIPGARRPDEVVMYGAHWDAYGEGAPDEAGRIYRAGANDDALGVGCANVVKQMVLPAGQPRELVHRLLDGVGAGDVVRVGALAGLEVDVRVLGRAAHDGMVGRQGAVAVGTNQVIVDHRPHDGFVDGGDLVDLMRGAEAVEEVDERHARLQRGGVGNEGEVHRLLHGIGTQQREAGIAGRHHVAMIAKNG